MTEPNASASVDNGPVYINQVTLGKLAPLMRKNAQVASVMLTMLSEIGSNGVVQVQLQSVAKLCHSTLQQVEKAVADLADAGLISSVDISTELVGSLACVINPDLARMSDPDQQV